MTGRGDCARSLLSVGARVALLFRLHCAPPRRRCRPPSVTITAARRAGWRNEAAIGRDLIRACATDVPVAGPQSVIGSHPAGAATVPVKPDIPMSYSHALTRLRS